MPTSTKQFPCDPTTVRLSEHFLLSDFLGNDSVYRHGIPNRFDGDQKKLNEGIDLANFVLEPLLVRSRLSISYGYISPEVSRLIVKYQDPDKPSYHRWDAGAACDVILHESKDAPILDAMWMDESLPMSRTITYSESPYICVGTRAEEIARGDPRRALYENRYVGERKPKYIPYSEVAVKRLAQKKEAKHWVAENDWKGKGWPSYHGGGRQQFHHIRVSEFTMLSDWLYNADAVEEGHKNQPEAFTPMEHKFRRAGQTYDNILKSLSILRMSIVRGYESPVWQGGRHNWTDEVCFVVVPPEHIKPMDVADAAMQSPGVTIAKVGRNRRVAIAVSFR